MTEHAGFSAGEPWIGIPDNYRQINVETEEQDSDSVLEYYKKLVRLRKQYAVIQKGTIEFLYQDQPDILAYRRNLDDQELLVINNLSGKTIKLPEGVWRQGCQRLLGNYSKEESIPGEMLPYESLILYHSSGRERIEKTLFRMHLKSVFFYIPKYAEKAPVARFLYA